jgi:hypothetical protein
VALNWGELPNFLDDLLDLSSQLSRGCKADRLAVSCVRTCSADIPEES